MEEPPPTMDDFPPLKPSSSSANAILLLLLFLIMPVLMFSPNMKPVLPSIDIPSRQPTKKNGCPAVILTSLELSRAEDQFKHTLVAKFSSGRPSINVIRHHVNTKWGLAQYAAVGLLDPRHVLIHLASHLDVVKANSCPHIIGSSLLRLFRWTSSYDVKKESSMAAVWVRLPGLSTLYFIPTYLKLIGDSFGTFLKADDRTLLLTHPMYARICVEMGISQPLPEEVWVGSSKDDKDGYWQCL